MKAILLATTAIMTLAAGAATAADLAVRKAPPVIAPACAQFGGFYLGANVGAVSYTAHRNDDDGLFVDNAGHTLTGNGWTGGVQGGYNWQRHCTVIGFEADWNWASASTNFQDNPNAPGQLHTIDTKLRSFGTVRGRAGVVVDNLLLYVTAGLAWVNTNTTYTDFTGAGTDIASFSTTRWGATAGFGAEFALGGGWTVKGEALYIQTGQYQHQFFAPFNGGNFRFTNNDNIWVARVGLNYIFGAGGPVMAAY